jgi:hypothetical protein
MIGDYEDGEIGGIKIGRGNRSTWRKPGPAPQRRKEHSEDLRNLHAYLGD